MSTDLKILVVPQMPYSLAQGGMEIIQDEVIRFLPLAGVAVEPFDLWKRELDANVAHVFGSEIGQTTVVGSLYGHRVPIVCTAMFMPAQSRFRHSVLRTVGDLLPGNPVLRRQRLLRQSAAIHALTEAEKSDIVTYLDIDPALIHVVPLGIAPQFFEATPDLFHERTGLRDVVLCVGSIEHRKNQMNVLTALSDIDRDVVFIGSPVKRADAADHAYHETFVQSVERHPRMHWFPAMRHGDPFLASAFAAAHVHILVSFIEAQGIVSLEAAAAGANIVVGDLPSQRELYGNTVVYADPASTQSIRSAVLNALARPRGSSPLPKNVLMTWDEVVTHFIEIYRSVV